MQSSQKPKVAYFSMEIGIKSSIPTYSGGLGILAGDILKSAADMGLPVVGVTLLYNFGYFKQGINQEGRQYEIYPNFDPRNELRELPERTHINLEGDDVTLRAWRYNIIGRNGHIVPVLFLDTNGVNGNNRGQSDITNHLYGGDKNYRIKQEAILGIGGVRMLEALGLNIDTYHMNEGHSAFLTLELLSKRNYDAEKVKESCVFTTHTPVAAGHDYFYYHDVKSILGNMVPLDIERHGANGELNMTLLALNLSRFANGVSEGHAEVARGMFPGYQIDSITNGIHTYTWTSSHIQKAYDLLVPEWRKDPSRLKKISDLPNAAELIKKAHDAAKAELFDYVKDTNGTKFDPKNLTIGFARRAAGYKRADLIFRDLDALRRMGGGKIQLIFSGKAHPHDDIGKGLVYRVNQGIRELGGNIPSVFLEDYNMDLGRLITQGVDVWLNTPQRPMEASGTSGMKAASGAVPSFSVLEGWFREGHKEGVTGWSIGYDSRENNDEEDLRDFLRKLENVLIPAYGGRDWETAMVGSVAHNGSHFHSERVVKEYAKKVWEIPLEERLAA